MKTVKKLLFGLLALLVLFALGTQFLPGHWSVTRSVSIQAPVQVIQPLLEDLHFGWPQWSSFDHEDPNIVYKTLNPSLGIGGERSWTSQLMGDGSQRITESSPGGVAFVLTMPAYHLELFGRFSFQVDGPNTVVTWTDQANTGLNPLARIMGTRMDAMMGPKFEASLAKLKEVAEARVKAAAAAPKAKAGAR